MASGVRQIKAENVILQRQMNAPATFALPTSLWVVNEHFLTMKWRIPEVSCAVITFFPLILRQSNQNQKALKQLSHPYPEVAPLSQQHYHQQQK